MKAKESIYTKPLNIRIVSRVQVYYNKIKGKLHFWSLSFTLYFNLVPNFLIVSI